MTPHVPDTHPTDPIDRRYTDPLHVPGEEYVRSKPGITVPLVLFLAVVAVVVWLGGEW